MIFSIGFKMFGNPKNLKKEKNYSSSKIKMYSI